MLMISLRNITLLVLIVLLKPGFSQTAKPAHNAQVILYMKNSERKPLALEMIFYGKSSKKYFKSISDKDGKIEIYLPTAESYFVYSPDSPEYFDLEIPSTPNNIIKKSFVIYTVEKGKIHSSPTEALLRFTIINPDNKPLSESITLIGEKSKKEFKGKSNEEGLADILVPINDSYNVNLPYAPSYEEIVVPSKPFYTIKERVSFMGSSQKFHPTTTQALFIIDYSDLEGNPVKDETIKIRELSTNKIYEAKTEVDGKVYVLVPIGSEYSVSAKYLPDAYVHTITKEARQYVNVKINYLSSSDYEFREMEKLKQIATRDSLFKLYGSRLKLDNDSIFKIKITSEAVAIRQQLKSDAKYFERKNSVVSAVFYRMGVNWKNKMIVADLTGSMDPYIDEILVWTKLQLVDGEKNSFVFFNDGNKKKTAQKIIGKTGGLYYCSSDNIDSLLLTIKSLNSGGRGGDEKENDLEALLEGAKKKKYIDELILIKDNYSPIRDISLLSELKIPVRIIVCGVKNEINEDALEIAYKTNGSIHTIEEDIKDLSKHMDGDIVKIGKMKYKICKGKFVVLK